jgi:hypothetical protein
LMQPWMSNAYNIDSRSIFGCKDFVIHSSFLVFAFQHAR